LIEELEETFLPKTEIFKKYKKLQIKIEIEE
jgi:hypothetical protein